MKKGLISKRKYDLLNSFSHMYQLSHKLISLYLVFAFSLIYIC